MLMIKRSDTPSEIAGENRGGKLGHHDHLLGVHFEGRVQVASGKRCMLRRHERDDETGAEVTKRIRLAVQQKTRSAFMNVETRH